MKDRTAIRLTLKGGKCSVGKKLIKIQTHIFVVSTGHVFLNKVYVKTFLGLNQTYNIVFYD